MSFLLDYFFSPGSSNQGWYISFGCYACFSSVQFSRSVVSDSLRPHESQHARPPCPSPTPRVYSNPCLSSRWCLLRLPQFSSEPLFPLFIILNYLKSPAEHSTSRICLFPCVRFRLNISGRTDCRWCYIPHPGFVCSVLGSDWTFLAEQIVGDAMFLLSHNIRRQDFRVSYYWQCQAPSLG